MRSKQVEVLENQLLQDNLYRLVLPFPHTAKAGQFVMVQKKNSAYLLARPISICDVVDDRLILLYQAIGRGTGELATLHTGDLVTLTGPIGHGFPIDELTAGQRVALVGGGVGTAPLLLTAKELVRKGFHCDAFIGFREKSMLRDELAEICHEVFVCTENGCEGTKGFVTAELNPEEYDVVYCCGPTPMMQAVIKECEESGTPVYVSLENHMACGVGACLVCTCADKQGKNKRTCLDGPVFRGEEIDFHA